MARANRHHILGQVWHITHRCHKKEFLLKFAKDRRRWLFWLFEAKKRYGLQVLNYTATSNHIHILVVDNSQDTISKSLQLIAGRTAQEFNQRKERNGAFWEDRYHATAVDRNEHLLRCLVYLDLNMVRAGVVSHPADWELCGYNEIQNPPTRYAVIDRVELQRLCGFTETESFKKEYMQWVEDALLNRNLQRESCWTESIAVGGRRFIEETKVLLGIKAVGRRNQERKTSQFVLKEDSTPYNADFAPEKVVLSQENAYFWDFNQVNSGG